MKKILIISTDLPPIHGGITRMLVNLARLLSKTHQVDFIHTSPNQSNSMPWEQGLVVKTLFIGGAKFKSVIRGLRFLHGLDFCEYDRIIIGNHIPLFFLFFIKLKKMKHKVYFIHVNNKEFGSGRFIRRSFYDKGVENFNNLVISDWLQQDFLNRGLMAEVLYPPMDIETIIKVAREEVPGIDKTVGINKITTVSRLFPHKGHKDVMKALNTLYPEGGYQYIITGKGPAEKEIREFACDLGISDNILITGHLTQGQLASIFAWCDIFVMPSKDTGNSVEGFGYSFIEANAFGKPVIGTHSGGIPSAVADGVSGILVDQDDIDQLKEALLKLLTDTEFAKAMGAAGKKRVIEKFDMYASRPAILALFDL